MTPTLEHFPLASAYLCEDCHCIGNCSTGCHACTSRSLFALAGVLNRKPVQPAGRVAALCEMLDEVLA